MRIIFFVFIQLVLSVYLTSRANAQAADSIAQKLSDADNNTERLALNNRGPASYQEALLQWKTIADISQWIQGNFRYDMARARLLAENSLKRNNTAIYTPDQLYRTGTGVCIDLARFSVETLAAIDTAKEVKYLLIEFEPVNIGNSIIRKHWLAVTKNESGYLIFADSKRPGHIAGPLAQIEDFISDYQQFRNRKIVSWNILPGYQREKKQLERRQKASLD